MSAISRHFSVDDRAASVYQYVPFDAPGNASGFTITMIYDRGAATIDLGLVGPTTFCGWSGGERSTVTVTREWATPGYLPAEPAGGWQVILGLYRVGTAGVDVTLDVEIATAALSEPAAPIAPPRLEPRPRRVIPAAPGREWLACDFHSHTVHSDGGLEIVDLGAFAARRGLDVLAVTDHNTTSHHRFLKAAGDHSGILLLPGQEVTTDEGHANCFGDVGWIDFREPADEWQAAAQARGGFLSVNHPWAGDCSWNKALRRPADFVEAWHSTWNRRDDEPLESWSDFGAIPIGGSDHHRETDGTLPGNPTTWVEAEGRTVEAVLAAMAQGRVAISASPDSPVLVRHEGELVAVDADGTKLVHGDGPSGGHWLVGDFDAVAAFSR